LPKQLAPTTYFSSSFRKYFPTLPDQSPLPIPRSQLPLISIAVISPLRVTCSWTHSAQEPKYRYTNHTDPFSGHANLRRSCSPTFKLQSSLRNIPSVYIMTQPTAFKTVIMGMKRELFRPVSSPKDCITNGGHERRSPFQLLVRRTSLRQRHTLAIVSACDHSTAKLISSTRTEFTGYWREIGAKEQVTRCLKQSTKN
jgi:hypothetical protein